MRVSVFVSGLGRGGKGRVAGIRGRLAYGLQFGLSYTHGQSPRAHKHMLAYKQTPAHTNTHRGQNLLSYLIGRTLTVVFNLVKHLCELTYAHHKGLMWLVCLRGFALDSVSPGIICYVAIACNIFTFPFLYIQALAVVFPNVFFCIALHCRGNELLTVCEWCELLAGLMQGLFLGYGCLLTT